MDSKEVRGGLLSESDVDRISESEGDDDDGEEIDIVRLENSDFGATFTPSQFQSVSAVDESDGVECQVIFNKD